MKTTYGNWRQSVSISKLSKMLMACAMLAITSFASAQQPLDVTLTPFEYNGAVNVRCNGGNTGRITAVATGGTAPYTFDWSAGTSVAGGTIVFGLYAGTTTVTVTDAAGASVTDSVTLTEPLEFISTTTWSPILCYGGTSTISTSAIGGTTPYNGITVTTELAGTYEYVLADANGCRAFDTAWIVEPAILDVTATPDPILCYGDMTNVAVVAAGGTAPYIGTGNFQVTAGSYSYDITDANGCTENVQLAVNQPAQLTASISATPILCNGGTSIVNVSVVSGTEPYTGNGNFVEEAGWHTYTVYDYNLCSDTIGILVTEPDAMVSTVTATPILCNGGTSTISVTGAGGTGAWTGTGTFTEPAGAYGYSFVDANGCTDTNSITVAEPAALSASATATSIDCNGGTSTVTVTATGGTAPLSGVGTFSVAAGTHDFTVTDANGCSITVSITATEPSALVASATATSIDCNGGTADVTVSATGGLAPLTGTGSFTVGGGTFDYTVTDASGCTSDVSVTVVEPAQLDAIATVASLDCSSLSSDVTIAATGGTAPYSGDGVINQGLGNTNYTVTDANGCTASVSAIVEVENFVDLTCPGNQTFACNYSQSCGSQNTGSLVSWDEPTASSFNTCDNGCGPNTAIPGFIYMGEYNGSRYYCSNTSNYSWQAANMAAINAGGHLATIQSAGENQFISSQIMANVAWIGLNDQNVEGTFEWSNGENVGYTNWGGYEPNNNGPTYNCGYCGEADYTVISSSQGGWYDRYECNLNEFVMEIPCGNPITITQTSGPSNGSFVAGGTTQTVTYVATDDVTGATATCSFTVHVEKCTPTYCESEGYCTAYEWIDQVGLGSINNQSGNDNGYGDYTTLATGAFVGDVINLTLTPGFSGQSYTEAWRVWVDWNYDGDFYDQGEMVYQGYGNSTLTSSFTVPSYATLNEDLRVRVSMRWNCYPGPCSIFQYGEVEDYTIFIQDDNGGIGGMQTVIGQNENGDLKQGNTALDNVKMYEDVVEDTEVGGIGLEVGDIYPNPVLATNGKFNLLVRIGHKSDVTVRIVDLSGKVLLTDLMHLETGANKRTMDVTGFAKGSYIVEVISGDLKETTQLIVQ